MICQVCKQIRGFSVAGMIWWDWILHMKAFYMVFEMSGLVEFSVLLAFGFFDLLVVTGYCIALRCLIRFSGLYDMLIVSTIGASFRRYTLA